MKNDYLKSSIYVANSILIFAKDKKIKIKPKKLYGLIYLVYSEYLYQTNQKLFNEVFEATQIGPVLPNVLFKFNCYGDKYIKTLATDAKGVAMYYENKGFFGYIVNEILDKYKDYTTPKIIEIITSQNSAYNKSVLNNKNVLCDTDILNEVIVRKNMQLEKTKKYKR